MSPRSSTTAADRGGRWGSTPTTLPRLPAPPVITSALRVIGCAEDRPTIPGRGQLQGDAPIQSDRSQSRWPGSTLQNKDTRFRGVENTKGSGPGSRLLPYRRPRPSGAPIEHREYEDPCSNRLPDGEARGEGPESSPGIRLRPSKHRGRP